MQREPERTTYTESRACRRRNVARGYAAFFICFIVMSIGLPVAMGQDTQDAPPPGVTVVTVESGIAAQAGEFAGRVVAINAQDILARVQGFLIERHFTEGQVVEKDDLLFTIEPDHFQAELEAAEAAMQSARAQLKERESNYQRVAGLRRQDAVSQTQLEDALAQRDSARATVKGAEADLSVAKLRLSYTNVRAAQAGRIGIAPITAGNIVDISTGALARIVQLDPIRIEYAISDRAYLDARAAEPDIDQEALNQKFVPTVLLANDTAYEEPGRVVFVDNEINPQTGTLTVWAEFENPNGVLLPGQTVRVAVERTDGVITPLVPRRAIVRTRGGTFVYIVDNDNRVEQRTIEIGPAPGDQVAVTDGLQAGERIVLDGIQKVQPGQQVTPSEGR